jgi:transposase
VARADPGGRAGPVPRVGHRPAHRAARGDPGAGRLPCGEAGNQVLDEVRRRVQQDTLGHRGYRDDPLYQVRRLLRRGLEHLTPDQLARIDTALQAGDPDWKVTIAWHLAQQLRATYRHPDPAEGKRRAERLLRILPTCPIREVARLG